MMLGDVRDFVSHYGGELGFAVREQNETRVDADEAARPRQWPRPDAAKRACKLSLQNGVMRGQGSSVKKDGPVQMLRCAALTEVQAQGATMARAGSKSTGSLRNRPQAATAGAASGSVV